MKKKRRITILVTAAVFLPCAPISLRAQEEPVRMGTEETEIPDKLREPAKKSNCTRRI